MRRCLKCGRYQVVRSEGDLHVSIDLEGVVRVPSLGEDDAVLICKLALEELLTEVYSMGLSGK